MSDEQIKEASWVVQGVAGASAYMYGVNYDEEKFKRDLDKALTNVKAKQAVAAR